MKTTVGIVDYDYGNTQSICNALQSLNINFILCPSPEKLDLCTHIILPGVGSFGASMKSLDRLNFLPALNKNILKKKKFFLGICVGFQIMFSEGYEFKISKGLNWIKGKCKKINTTKYKNLILPHNGWNEVQNHENFKLFNGNARVDNNFYFIHSFIVTDIEKKANIISCYSDYGEKFVSAIQKDNIFGVQFHPEKSQNNGLKFLENFSKLK